MSLVRVALLCMVIMYLFAIVAFMFLRRLMWLVALLIAFCFQDAVRVLPDCRLLRPRTKISEMSAAFFVFYVLKSTPYQLCGKSVVKSQTEIQYVWPTDSPHRLWLRTRITAKVSAYGYSQRVSRVLLRLNRNNRYSKIIYSSIPYWKQWINWVVKARSHESE